MECEANYRDDKVCPPLVGLQKLLDAQRANGTLTPKQEARWAKLQRDREDV